MGDYWDAVVVSWPTNKQTGPSKTHHDRCQGGLFWNCITGLLLPTSYLEKKLSQSSHSRNLQRPPWLASCSIRNPKVKPIIVRKYEVVLTDLEMLSCSGRHIPVVEDCLCSEYLTHRKELRVRPPRLPNSFYKNWLLRTRFPTEGFTLGKRKGIFIGTIAPPEYERREWHSISIRGAKVIPANPAINATLEQILYEFVSASSSVARCRTRHQFDSI
mgnify:CR=1 FL=1